MISVISKGLFQKVHYWLSGFSDWILFLIGSADVFMMTTFWASKKLSQEDSETANKLFFK